MSIRKTNIFEIILRNNLIGTTIYDNDNVPIIVSELNYDPSVRCMYVTDGVKKFKIKVDDYFNYEYDDSLEVSSTRNLPGVANKFKNKI